MKDQSWIADLLAGYKNILLNGTPIKRRDTIDLVSGFTASDDPTNAKTLLTAAGTGFTRTTADFVQPAANATVSVRVGDSSTLVVGFGALIQNGGVYEVDSITDATHVVLTNLGDPHNASPGATISSGALVIASSSGQNPPGIGPIVNQVDGVSIALPTNEGQAAVMVGGIPSPVGHRRVFNVLSYGAKGDGVHDDAAAIQAAEHARSLFTAGGNFGGVLYFPAGMYMVGTELHTEGRGPIWEGDGTASNTTLKAVGHLRSVLRVQHQLGRFSDFFIDGSGADHCILRSDDSQTHYEKVNCYGALFDGFSSIGSLLPGRTISSIVQAGSGPAITATASVLVGVGTQPNSLIIKIDSGGVTYKVSVDGGSTYGQSQNIVATSYPANPRGGSLISDASGVAVTFSGTYIAGTTYTINFDYTNSRLCVNDSAVFTNCGAARCGQWFWSPGATNPGGFLQNTAVAGSVTTTANSQIVTASGFDFTTTGARPGDYIYIVAAAAWYQILAVLDATHLAIGVSATSGNTAIGNNSASDFIISVGAGFYDALQFDAGVQIINGGNFGASCAQSLVWASTSAGNLANSVSFQSQAGVGVTVGYDNQTAVGSSVLIRPYFENGLSISIPVELFDAYTIVHNATNLTFQGGFINGSVINAGVSYGLTRETINAEFWQVDNSQNITADSQAITVPTGLINDFTKTTLRLNPNAVYFLGPLSTPNVNGIVVRLHNVGSFPMNIRDSAFGTLYHLQSPQLVLSPGGFIDFYYFNSAWYQIGAVRPGAVNTQGYPAGPGESCTVTTDATPFTLLWPNIWNDPTFSGFSADITATLSDGSQLGVWEDVRARFANNAQIGTLTIGHATGTNSGNPPSAWSIALVFASGNWQLRVTGAASTTIQWRGRIRFF